VLFVVIECKVVEQLFGELYLEVELLREGFVVGLQCLDGIDLRRRLPAREQLFERVVCAAVCDRAVGLAVQVLELPLQPFRGFCFRIAANAVASPSMGPDSLPMVM
jgi:hypothetical protein